MTPTEQLAERLMLTWESTWFPRPLRTLREMNPTFQAAWLAVAGEVQKMLRTERKRSQIK